MKFKTEKDQIIFEALNMNEQTIRKRLQLVKKSIDRKKSRTMKDQWRRNKYKLLKGLRKWHKSTQGKRFHRALGRFNALRENNNEVINVSFDDITDALFALSSIETHLYLELKYYESDIEALSDFLTIIDMFFEEEAYLKKILLNAYITGVILKEDLERIKDLISFFVDPLLYYYELRSLNGLNNDINQLKKEDLEIFTKQKNYILNNIYKENIIDEINDFIKECNGGQGDLGTAPTGKLGIIPNILKSGDFVEYDSNENDSSENNIKENKKSILKNILNT